VINSKLDVPFVYFLFDEPNMMPLGFFAIIFQIIYLQITMRMIMLELFLGR
jgi:hypothetical protein